MQGLRPAAKAADEANSTNSSTRPLLIHAAAVSRHGVAMATTASSYQSASDVRVHFGLGASSAARLEVRWPSGVVQTVSALPAQGEIDVDEPSPSPRRDD